LSPGTTLALDASPPTAQPTTTAPLDLSRLDAPSLQSPSPQPLVAGSRAFDGPMGDGRRTLTAFPANLARGVLGVLSRENVVPFALGTGIAFTGHGLDGRAEGWLEGRCLSCGRTGASAGGTGAMASVIGAVFVAGRLSPQGPFRAFSYDFAQALAVNAVWTSALKLSLRRERPDGSDPYSLPSGHTSSAFALATVARNHYGWKVGVPAYVLASGIGLSRIESGKHHFSDVLAGATLGVVVGRTVTRLNGESAGRRRSFSVAPATDARGNGVGLSFAASW
jgi:membrane-associated phospholipid phosphatase